MSDTTRTATPVFQGAVTIFVAIATATYSVAAVQSLLHPLNRGSDRIWACVTLALGAIAAIPRWDRVMVPLLAGAQALLSLLIAILSGQFPALLAAAAVLIVAHALGATILEAAGFGAGSRLERAVLAFAAE